MSYFSDMSRRNLVAARADVERARRRYESRTGKSYDERLKVRSAVFWCAVTAVLVCIAIWGLLRTLFG